MKEPYQSIMTLGEIVDSEQPSGKAVRSSELVVLLRGWQERAQQCRDAAHEDIDWENNPTGLTNGLLVRARALDDCAKELEIAMQHNDPSSATTGDSDAGRKGKHGKAGQWFAGAHG